MGQVQNRDGIFSRQNSLSGPRERESQDISDDQVVQFARRAAKFHKGWTADVEDQLTRIFPLKKSDLKRVKAIIEAEASRLKCILYFCTYREDDESLRKMVAAAQINNRKYDITGYIMYDPVKKTCVQYIEGRTRDIGNLYDNISKDDRADPKSFVLLKDAEISKRKYTEWSMKLDTVDLKQLEEDWEHKTNKWKDLYPDDKNQVGIDDDILKRASEMLEFSNADWNTIRL